MVTILSAGEPYIPKAQTKTDCKPWRKFRHMFHIPKVKLALLIFIFQVHTFRVFLMFFFWSKTWVNPGDLSQWKVKVNVLSPSYNLNRFFI